MIKTMDWRGNVLVLLDQTKLPDIIDFIACYDYRRVAQAIRSMEVRGAPAIGVAAAFAMVLGYKEIRMHGLSGTDVLRELEVIKRELVATRPTAVNLAWAVNKIWDVAVRSITNRTIDSVDVLESAAVQIYENNISNNIKIGHFGSALLPSNAAVLTHCNAGALATCGWGTALGVVRQGYADGKIKMVYADETRPLLQGARLTAWELEQDDIPVTLITDNMAAWTMKTKRIKAVIVGADRIALNGDVANKIGTYGVALAAHALPSEDTANNFSEFLKSFKPIRQNNINKKFLYTDAIAGYDFTLPKDWCYVQGKMGELGLFTVALPLDKLSNVLEAVINIGIPVSQGMEDQEIAKILMKATDEGIVAFSSKKTLKKNSMFYDILNNMRNSDAEHIDFSLQQLKNNLGNELNKADFTIDYIAAAANSDANKNLIINLKSRLVYNKDFPIELNSKTLINDSFISSMNYFKHTGEKNSQRANLALIRRIDNLKVAQK